MTDTVRRLGELLVAAVLGGCASSSSGEVPIPTASVGGSAPSAAPPSSVALELPKKDPKSASWEVNGALCVPSWGTVGGRPGQCGPRPGSWASCPSCGFIHSTELSASEGARRGGDACCYSRLYEPDEPMMLGRPLLGPAGPILAASASVPDQPLLAAAWEQDARMEHASVAAFATLALELLGLGAPAELVRRAHEAARDELVHAELCLRLARRHGGAGVVFGPLAVGEARPRASTLLEVAQRALDEGCLGEALASAVAAEGATSARDPETTAALARISSDEARHAELSAAIVGWASQRLSADERLELRSLLERRAAEQRPFAGRAGLEGEGRLAPARVTQLRADVVAHVLRPVLAAVSALAA